MVEITCRTNTRRECVITVVFQAFQATMARFRTVGDTSKKIISIADEASAPFCLGSIAITTRFLWRWFASAPVGNRS